MDPILDIYILRVFQWYKEILNPMKFDPSHLFLKIQKSIRTTTLKVGVHLGVLWAHSLTLSRIAGNVNVILGLHAQLAPFHALALVTSPRLGS